MPLRWLYLINISLLIAHEIDSAYWMEWEMFGLPGGNGGFFALHIPLVALFVWGYGRVIAATRAGFWLSLLTCVAGFFAFGIHATFLVAGYTQFREPASLALLAAIAVVSGFQTPATIRRMRPDARAPIAGSSPASAALTEQTLDHPTVEQDWLDQPAGQPRPSGSRRSRSARRRGRR
ncbi:MAG: hypothetical protein HKP61_02135 [Dactylosporangium sp.]|nr:hypothetical protein [Dactylosporangium sp.]NNJ59761.1 hypothetical protein [Dactylosporangium sp.]